MSLTDDTTAVRMENTVRISLSQAKVEDIVAAWVRARFDHLQEYSDVLCQIDTGGFEGCRFSCVVTAKQIQEDPA